MSTEKELDFIPVKDKEATLTDSWLVAFSQKLTLCLLRLRDRLEISDDDYELLRALHKFHYNGEYQIFKVKSAITDEKAEQIGLFAENKSVIPAKSAEIDPHDDYAK